MTAKNEKENDDNAVEILSDDLIACTNATQSGILANDLYEALAASQSPLVHVRRLLKSSNELAILGGLFIVDELREKARELLPEVEDLLSHVSPSVRSSTVDVLAHSVETTDGAILAKLVELVGDTAPEVHWSVISALAHMDRKKLLAAARCLTGSTARRVERLADTEAVASKGIRDQLCAESHEDRAFALAAALRIADEDDDPLRWAKVAHDDEHGRQARAFPYGDPISTACPASLHSVRLRVWGPRLEPDKVSSLTRCSPTRCWKKGERIPSDSRRSPRRGGVWELELSAESGGLEDLVEEVHRRCNGKLRALSRMANVTLVVRVDPVVPGEFMLELNSRVLALLESVELVVEMLES